MTAYPVETDQVFGSSEGVVRDLDQWKCFISYPLRVDSALHWFCSSCFSCLSFGVASHAEVSHLHGFEYDWESTRKIFCDVDLNDALPLYIHPGFEEQDRSNSLTIGNELPLNRGAR